MLSNRAAIATTVGVFVVAGAAATAFGVLKYNQHEARLDDLRATAAEFYAEVRDSGASAINNVPGLCRAMSDSDYDPSLYIWITSASFPTERALEARGLLQQGNYTLSIDMDGDFATVLGPSTDSVVTPSWWYLHDDGWKLGCNASESG